MRTITMFAFVLVAAPAYAGEARSWGEEMEGRVSGLATYATGAAIGESHEFAPIYGWLGFNAEVMYHARADLSIGLTSGYQLFRGKGRETTEFDGAALTAYQFRFLDTAPILAVARYYVDLGGTAMFYPALGVGTVYTNREVNAGFVGIHDDTWHFAVAPQAGIAFHTYGPDPLLQVKYTYAPGGDENPTESWFSVELGCFFE
jgi:hypothetical protein